jgi:RNA-binding protein
MDLLKGFQKRYLRGLAHALKPVVFVGQRGFTQSLVDAMDDALDHHELVKVKFLEFKEKEKKLALVGHMATFFRRQSDPEKRKITLPSRSGD